MIAAALWTSFLVLKAEKLSRSVPVSRVPALSWASGAQWRPARTATSRAASSWAAVSQSTPSTVHLRLAMEAADSGRAVQPLQRQLQEAALMAQQLCGTLPLHKAQALRETTDTGDVVGPRLPCVGWKIRHLLLPRKAARAPFHQRL